ncbi:MAG TPA: hypothetical protein PKM57_09900 [Kiritimatiellia bacterium]|nr:hypothetical protein [Kiritimatiellia bacterium]HPS08204.1 hypothetical protein [Kiritimatiellia bacterium]
MFAVLGHSTPKSWRCFIDWHPTLRRLAERLGKAGEVAFISEAVARMERAAREHLWDDPPGRISRRGLGCCFPAGIAISFSP